MVNGEGQHHLPALDPSGLFFDALHLAGINIKAEGAIIVPTPTGFNITLPRSALLDLLNGVPHVIPSTSGKMVCFQGFRGFGGEVVTTRCLLTKHPSDRICSWYSGMRSFIMLCDTNQTFTLR